MSYICYENYFFCLFKRISCLIFNLTFVLIAALYWTLYSTTTLLIGCWRYGGDALYGGYKESSLNEPVHSL